MRVRKSLVRAGGKEREGERERRGCAVHVWMCARGHEQAAAARMRRVRAGGDAAAAPPACRPAPAARQPTLACSPFPAARAEASHPEGEGEGEDGAEEEGVRRDFPPTGPHPGLRRRAQRLQRARQLFHQHAAAPLLMVLLLNGGAAAAAAGAAAVLFSGGGGGWPRCCDGEALTSGGRRAGADGATAPSGGGYSSSLLSRVAALGRRWRAGLGAG